MLENSKPCSKCLLIKPYSLFNVQTGTSSGRRSQCKSCMQATRSEKADTKSISDREYREKNKEKIRIKQKEYRHRNSASIKSAKKSYYSENKHSVIGRSAAWYRENKKKKQEYDKKYRESRSELIRSIFSDRYKNDPMFRLKDNIRGLILQAFRKKGYGKRSKTREILGCSFDELKSHIESQFSTGMSWCNRAEWHIDHIIPVSSAQSEQELIALNHYTNLRPLWAFENLSKGAKYCEEDASRFFSKMGSYK